MRTATYIGIAIAAFIAIYVVGVFLTGSLSIFTSDFRGEVEKHEQVEAQGEYRVAQYDYFFNLCGDIQAKQQNIKQLESLGPEYNEEVTANRMQLNEMVSEYNSAASSEYTKGQFKDDELPYQISAEREVESCGTP